MILKVKAQHTKKHSVQVYMIKIKHILFIAVMMIVLEACSNSGRPSLPTTYPRMIGDIAYDESIDSADVALCNDEDIAVQYYFYTNLKGKYPYLNDKHEVISIFRKHYDASQATKESGLIRIRFLVNCHGAAGRYRVIGMDEDYKSKEFDLSITNQLLSITKEKLKWAPFVSEGNEVDYYMYLIFKIEQGKIKEILP